MTLLSPPFMLIRTGSVYGANEGGDNNGTSTLCHFWSKGKWWYH